MRVSYSWVMRNLGMTLELYDETLSAIGAHLLAKHARLLRYSSGEAHS